MGAVLQERPCAKPSAREKLMPSARLLLFSHLYQESGKPRPGKLAEKRGISAMQTTRAARQPQRLNLFDVSKDGVSVAIRGKLSHRPLFDSAKPYLIDPAREVVHVAQNAGAKGLPFSGISALANSRRSPATLSRFAPFTAKLT